MLEKLNSDRFSLSWYSIVMLLEETIVPNPVKKSITVKNTRKHQERTKKEFVVETNTKALAIFRRPTCHSYLLPCYCALSTSTV